MLVALSDTHSVEDPKLTPHLRSIITDADVVAHTGDFTTESVLDSFKSQSQQFVAVRGNRETKAVYDRLPETATVDWAGYRFVLAHGHRHDETALSMLARQEDADVILKGHSHRPVIERLDERLLVNPGSYADPRGNQPAYASFEDTGEEITVTLRTPEGSDLSTETLEK